MYSVIVREKKWVSILGVVCTIFFAALAFFGIRQGIQKNDTAEIILCGVVGGAFAILGICVILDGLLRELALGYQDCYYRTMFGRTKRFALRDIAKVEIKNEYIYLLDASGKKIVRFESNMDQAAEALEFIRNRNFDEYGQPRVSVHCKELKPKQKEKLEKQRKEARKIQEKWEAAESAWARKRLFYEDPQWIEMLRVVAWILNLGGFAAFFLVLKLPFTMSVTVCAVYPLVVWLFWLCFHRVMVWKKYDFLSSEEKKYIIVPFYGSFLLFVASYNWIEFFYTGKVLLFSLLLFGVLLVLMLVVTHTPKGWLELALPVIFLVFYSFVNIYHWPVVLHTGQTRHVEVQVVGKDVETHFRGGDDYYFDIQFPNKEVWTVEVFGVVYGRTEEGDTVDLCVNSSLLGEYYYVHDTDVDCEWLR